jgi:phospholipid/cholesterol/gamma-HCH transport system permease protein
MIMGVIEWSGRIISRNAIAAGRSTSLFLAATVQLPHARRNIIQIVRQLDICGYGSILVLTLIAGLTGMIMAVQTGSELQNFGVLNKLGAIIGATFCREMGPLWAAVIMLARVGSSMAAELGTMTVNEEVDALRVMSINPVRYLVVPRLIALAIAMPLLTALADAVGLMGGALATHALFGQPVSVFFDAAWSLLTYVDFYSGLVKGFVFALIIGTIACDQGLNTHGGAEGVGQSTTRTVVLSIIFVLIADLFLTSVILRVVKPLVD